jgi:hypothetical protein
MKHNVGKIDQTIRLIVGVLLIGASLFVSTILQIIFLIVGILMVITAALSFCPIYLIFKFDSARQKEERE